MVDKRKLERILQAAFPGLSKEEANRMTTNGRMKTFAEGVALCQEGAFESTFYVIIKGKVAVTKRINDREDRFLKYLERGDFFGEMAIIHDAPRAATITTTEETTVLEITKESFKNFLEESSTVSLAIVREVSSRLRENDEMAIEDLRSNARELALAYQQLAELDFARREFLTTIAHELRTPLMAAIGYMQIVNTGMLQGQGLVSAMETVERNLQEIVTLTNNILFLQEMDLILPDFKLTDIASVITSAVEQQRQHAEHNSVGINLKISPDLPKTKADTPSLERALEAILDNAIKFSPDGGNVTVLVEKTDNGIVVTIIDQGVGIQPEDLPHIFDRFYHQEKIGNHLFRGIGLGLSIAREVISQHKGVIEVHSEPGKGSTFIIRLPLITQ
jgi:signal transduction histidine kinase